MDIYCLPGLLSTAAINTVSNLGREGFILSYRLCSPSWREARAGTGVGTPGGLLLTGLFSLLYYINPGPSSPGVALPTG